jgi:hypothetical protein
MAQAAFSSRVLDRDRNALAAVDSDYWVMNKGPALIYAAALEMVGQTIETTDAYSHAWFYEDRGIGSSDDIKPQTGVSNVTTGTPLTWGALVQSFNKRCTTDGNSVDSLKEITNTGQASSDAPLVNITAGQNSESQVGITVAGVQDRDGRVVVTTMRTAIAIGGGAETAFLAKLRFPKPHAVGKTRYPMPRLRAPVAGRR